MSQAMLEHMRLVRYRERSQLCAIWVDGPDSEAARACLPRLPMLAIPVLPTDHDADRRMDEMMRKLNAERVYQPLEVEPDYRAMWEALRTWAGNIGADRVTGVDVLVEMLARMDEVGKPTPDSDHVPAVRRVVAWAAGRRLRDDVWMAYVDAAYELLERARKRRPSGHGHAWPGSRVRRLAAYLRHRDEEAGYQ